MATILAQTPICEGFRNVAVGANPIQLKLGIEKAVEAVVADLKPVSVPVKGLPGRSLHRRHFIQDETIGEPIADAMDKVGKDGLTIDDSQGIGTELELVEGMQLDGDPPEATSFS